MRIFQILFAIALVLWFTGWKLDDAVRAFRDVTGMTAAEETARNEAYAARMRREAECSKKYPNLSHMHAKWQVCAHAGE